MHNHVLPWTDRPLVTQNLLGGEEGISDAGPLAVAAVPEPGRSSWRRRPRSTAASRRSCSSAPDARRPRPTSGRLRALPRPHRVHEPRPRRLVRPRAQRATRSTAATRALIGADVDLPLAAAAPRDLPPARSRAPSWCGAGASWQPAATASAFGVYVSGEYQFARRWFAGARFDHSERADDPGARGQGRLAAPHLLAERVQPGARPVPPHRATARASRPTSSSSSSSSPSAPTAPIRSDGVIHETAPLAVPRRPGRASRAGRARGRRPQGRHHHRGPRLPRRARWAATGSRSSRWPAATRTRTSWRPSRASCSSCNKADLLIAVGPRAGDRLAAAAHHTRAATRRSSPGPPGYLDASLTAQILEIPHRPDHARHGRRAPLGQPALLARSRQRPAHRPGHRRRSSSALDARATRPTSRSATPTSTSGWPRRRSAGTRRWRPTRG